MTDKIKGFTNTSMINQEAAAWIVLIEDTPQLSAQQISELNAWVATSEVHKQCLEQMARSWGELDLLASVMLPQEMRQPSPFSLLGAKVFFPVLALYAFILACVKQKHYWGRAALATALVGVCVAWLNHDPAPHIPDANYLVLKTKMGENTQHLMPDGSLLWLNSSSKIEVSYQENLRKINLIEGEAHFKVAKDAARPFEVYVDNRLVRAIGTAFSVHKVEGKIEVLVSEGTVELAIVDQTLTVTPDQEAPIAIATAPDSAITANSSVQPKKVLGRLSAGQRISIPIESPNMGDIDQLDISEVTRFLSWKEGKLIFAGESLEEVIKEITRHTPIKIDVVDPELKTMRIGGQFKVGETETLFYVLESGFGISANRLNANHVELRVKSH
jgi:transmembrane sensor